MAPSVSESQLSQEAKVERQNKVMELKGLRIATTVARSLTQGTRAFGAFESAMLAVYAVHDIEESKTLWGNGNLERQTDMEIAGLKVALAVAEKLLLGSWEASVLREAIKAASRPYVDNPTSTNHSKAITTTETHAQKNSDVSKPKEITNPPPYSP